VRTRCNAAGVLSFKQGVEDLVCMCLFGTVLLSLVGLLVVKMDARDASLCCYCGEEVE